VLNDVVNSIIHLDQGKLEIYQGNYDSFDRQRREKQALNVKLRKKQDDQRSHMMSYVERFRFKASKARQAQSRLKALARLEPVVDIVDSRVVPIRFPNPKRELAPPLVSMDEASAGYVAGKPVIRNLTLRIDPDDRIALLGANGNGKSTFAKLLTGKLQSQSGTIATAPKMSVGFFAQHQMDELDEDRTPFEYITSLMPDRTVAERRAKLGAAGFGATLADSKCSTLSGGEKARLLFLQAAFNGPHVLILDEPTNHLDMDSRESLIQAINDFEGAVILIAHDRHIIETCADSLWLVENGTIKAFDGDMDDYETHVLSRRRVAAPVQRNEKPAPKPAMPKPKSIFKEVQKLEAQMQQVKDKIAVLDEALADHTIYSEEPRKAADFARLRTKLAGDLEAIEMQWLELHEEQDAR
jgi:ATP-binding cassette, subfamily F, member 3